MAIGAAGVTAMLSALALKHRGISPDDGEVLVTGASGWVGSIAIAPTRSSTTKWALQPARLLKVCPSLALVGALDAVSGRSLANIGADGLRRRRDHVHVCRRARSSHVSPAVILRVVTLVGVDSVRAPDAARQKAWERLAIDLDLEKLGSTISVVGPPDVAGVARDVPSGKN